MDSGVGAFLGASVSFPNALMLGSNTSTLPIPSTSPCENNNSSTVQLAVIEAKVTIEWLSDT